MIPPRIKEGREPICGPIHVCANCDNTNSGVGKIAGVISQKMRHLKEHPKKNFTEIDKGESKDES